MNTFSSRNSNLLKLMRLASPSLPIGAYSYSQGLEYAVTSGWVNDMSSALKWIEGVLKNSLMYLDVPVLKRLFQAWENDDTQKIRFWNNYLLASRDAMELQKEDLQMGKALARLLHDLGIKEAEEFLYEPNCFLVLFTLAATRWNILLSDTANGFLWMWGENQVLSSIKLIPLGQTEGQKILSLIIDIIPEIVLDGLNLGDDEIGFTAFGQGIASALHETQYTRLFRS